jgi:hypothetical protein
VDTIVMRPSSWPDVAGYRRHAFIVMAGLVPAIHVFAFVRAEDVDGRHKAGHDDENQRVYTPLLQPPPAAGKEDP